MDDLEWDKVGIEPLRFAVNEGEKLLKETNETAKYQTDRVVLILKLVIPLLVGMIGFLVSQPPKNSIIYVESIFLTAFLFVLFILSIKVYKSYRVFSPGNLPKNILKKETLEFAGEKKQELILFNKCECLDDMVSFNHLRNEERAAKIHQIEKVIFSGIIGLLALPWLWYLVWKFLFEEEVCFP